MRYIFLILASVCTSFGQQIRPLVWLDFEDHSFTNADVRDISLRENHARHMDVTNRITLTNGVYGSGGCWLTNGVMMTDGQGHYYSVSQYLALTNSTLAQSMANFTLTVWAKHFSKGYGDDVELGCIVDAGNEPFYFGASASNSWRLGREYSDIMRFTIYPTNTDSGVSAVAFPAEVINGGALPSPGNLATSNFNHYAVSFDGSDSGKIVGYYNGTPITTNDTGLPWLRAHPYICIGAHNHGGTATWGDDENGSGGYPNSGYFYGIIDDFRIYSATLTPAQIGRVYSNLTASVAGAQAVSVGRVQPSGRVTLQ